MHTRIQEKESVVDQKKLSMKKKLWKQKSENVNMKTKKLVGPKHHGVMDKSGKNLIRSLLLWCLGVPGSNPASVWIAI